MHSTFATSQSANHSPKQLRRKSYALPYYEQAHAWYRYARALRERPFDAYHRKEEALAASIRLRGRSFVFPAKLERLADNEDGLRRLRERVDEARHRFIEVAVRIVEVDEDDPSADEVHLYVEEVDRTSSRNRRLKIGRLPREDAFWAIPLLRPGCEGSIPMLQFFVERIGLGGSEADVHVVIARAHEAARSWFDWMDERKEHAERSYRVTYYEERVYAEA